MLTFETLKRAFQPLSRIGMDEVRFEVRGDVIVLRPIRPHEEVIVGRYAREALEQVPDGEDPDQVSALEYINRYKVMTLAFAVVQINDLDLRDQDYVTLPEKTESGRSIRVPRHVAMRDLITDMWSPTLIRSVHARYSQLLEDIAREYADLVEISPADLDTEIARLEQELERLKREREARAQGDSNIPKKDMERLFRPPEPKIQEPAVQEPEPVILDRMPTEQDYRDISGSAETAPPGDPEEDVELPQEPVHGGVVPPQPQPQPPADSFGDVDDPEVLAAEQARILAARRRARAEQATATRTHRRVPPHMRGREQEVGLSGGEVRMATEEELARMGIPPNLVQDDPTVTVPTPPSPEVISPRGRRHRQQERSLEIDPPPGRGNRNPMFVGPDKLRR